VEAARAGDPGAQRLIFEDNRNHLARQLFRLTGGSDEADDLLQEVFISAFANLDRFRGEAQLRTWLARIASNRARNWLDGQARRRRRDLRGVPPDPDFTADAPDRYYEAQERLREFGRAMRSLAPAFRDAYVARMIEGRSLEETSEALRVPISTVSYRARRAEVLLCKALGLPLAEAHVREGEACGPRPWRSATRELGPARRRPSDGRA
jgi:RNA polymerase sigma-70 factor (ECF subfamily)